MGWDFRSGVVLLDKYRIESVLGRGAMGIVLRATHIHLGEQVALKVLAPEVAVNPEYHARFLREAQAAVRLRGEHVARVSDVGILPDGAPYMVMEYLRGTDLAGEIARRGILSPGEAVDHVLQACEALAEAHACGIVHRDIKPSNLFLTARPDGTPLVKVLDFGISKTPVSGRGILTATATVMGTPGYMSPEQMKATRDVDARSDIWALGIVLYEFLTGHRPFDAEAFSAVVMLVATEPPPPMDPRLPRGLQSVVLRCLAKDREGRFASIAELTAALAPFARDQRAAGIVVERTRAMLQGTRAISEPIVPPRSPQTVTTLQATTGARSGPGVRRFRYAAVGTLALVGVIVVLFVVALTGSHGSGDSGGPPGAGTAVEALLDAGSALASAATQDARVAPVAAEPASGSAAAKDAAVATMLRPKVKPDDEKTQQAQIAKCTEAQAHKDWVELDDCGRVLRELGAAEKAAEFHSTAKRELQNSIVDADARAALRVGKLKEAAAILRKIGNDSVYFESLRDLLARTEDVQVEDAHRKAQQLANVHYCAPLKRYVQVLATGNNGTERVVAAAAAVNCVEQGAAMTPLPENPNLPKPTSSSGDGTSGGSGQATPAKRDVCETIDVDEMMTQANNQANAGFAPAALSLVVKTLKCRQDVRTYRIAVAYACAAHNAGTAKFYFAKVPAQFQASLIQRCLQEGIALP